MLNKSQYRQEYLSPPNWRKKVLHGTASMMLALTVGFVPYAQADDNSGKVQFTKPDYKVPEMAGHVQLWVSRTDGSQGAISVKYGTINGDAKHGADYEKKEGTLNWGHNDGEKKSIEIEIQPNPEKEKHKNFFVTLFDDTGASGTVNIGKLFLTKVHIDDNKGPEKPEGEGPVGPPPPPPPPVDDTGTPTTPGDMPPPPPGKDGPPPVIEEGDVAVSEGRDVTIGTHQTNIFSVTTTSVIVKTTIVAGVTKVTQKLFSANMFSTRSHFGFVKKKAVHKFKKKGKIKVKTKAGNRDGDFDSLSNAFLSALETTVGDTISTVSVDTTGDVLADFAGGFGISFKAYEPSNCNQAAGWYTNDDGSIGLAFEYEDGEGSMQCSDMAATLAPEIVKAIAEANVCDPFVLALEDNTVTCGSVTVEPNPMTASDTCITLEYQETEDGYSVCADGVRQEVEVK
ncbi:Calx-beta domain-containing protein [Candidatus Parabeggiatoa sp. HSG14]|uniref:Calx-beta domain-containing protein n=1 Tax=Candidatus Parabeggiatoa sp. HSG14 TaxID=3055593 RepID=UPI0025A89A17|nr:Calx-beta domain-containing protein [Thiotrichales bacterium HSG14]